MPPRVPARARPLVTSPFARTQPLPPSTDEFTVGDRVTLDRWGMGRVVRVTALEVMVDFGSAGVRRIPAGTKGFSRL